MLLSNKESDPKLLNRAEDLMGNSICEVYKRHLEKALEVFIGFTCWMGLPLYPASNELLVAFLAWLELSKRTSEMPTCLAAIAREYKVIDVVVPKFKNKRLSTSNSVDMSNYFQSQLDKCSK
ncbi:20956_t:CDS:2 [Dentiscutata erythropus]|uniref:20956_t:CDS:1 n=1 Tax=Dentiscutata erythropus TaxID=1348616 RepID=A0A9N9ASX8_9GLOM|nr:20956_t:CDS:2 [Dentiscutata erythropus]